MSRAEALAAWLDQAVETPRAWGVHDCNLWPANWVLECTGRDPAEPWRSCYRSASGAARIVRRAGGLRALWSAAACRVELAEARRRIAGDIGLVRLSSPGVADVLGEMVGAICIGGGDWAVVTEGGLLMGRFSVVQAWRPEWRTR